MNNKATGVHDIPNRLLNDSVDVIAPFPTEILNCSLLSKMFPDDLKTGKVAPVFKSGDCDNLNITIDLILFFQQLLGSLKN